MNGIVILIDMNITGNLIFTLCCTTLTTHNLTFEHSVLLQILTVNIQRYIYNLIQIVTLFLIGLKNKIV